jgi:hypothetical protein
MAQTSHLKSAIITAMETVPPTQATIGEGAAGWLQEVNGFVTTVSLDALASTYQLVRVPTTAKVKRVIFEAEAMTQGEFQLGVYYSSSTSDGTASPNAGLVVTSSGSTSQVNFFSGDIDCTSAVTPVDRTYYGTALNTLDKRNQPLWQACGLTADPKGFFDIVATCDGATVTTGARMGVTVLYCE